MSGFAQYQEKLVAAVSAAAISFVVFAGTVMPIAGDPMPYYGLVA